MKLLKPALALLLTWCAGGGLARAQSEFSLRHEALERILAAQVFTADGRLFLRGDANSRCSYAYLQNPKVSSDGPRLKLRARFSGRSALNLFGRCVGMGATFGLVVSSLPYYRNGALRMREVAVTCDAEGVYVRGVCMSLARSLELDFRYDLKTRLAGMLHSECDSSPLLYRRELEAVEVTGIRVASDRVILLLQLRLALK
jgi:hypothetical protein